MLLLLNFAISQSMLGDLLGINARITLQSPQHCQIQQHTYWSSGMAITVRYILHFFFAASFFTFGNIMWTQGAKVEGAFDSLNQAAFAAALTAMLSAFDEEPKSLWLALCAGAVRLLSVPRIRTWFTSF